MIERVELEAELRSDRGSAAARRMRRQGRLPAVLYGHEVDGVPLTLDARTVDHLLGAGGFKGLIDLKISGKAPDLMKGGPLLVLVKDHQGDPITRGLLHVDLYKVNLKEEVTVSIPVDIQGEAPGVKAGGILDILRREVEVRCLPDKIPGTIPADVSQLEQGQSLHVEDLSFPEGVTVQTDASFTVVSVVAPTKVEEPVEEAAEAGLPTEEGEPKEEKAEGQKEKAEE